MTTATSMRGTLATLLLACSLNVHGGEIIVDFFAPEAGVGFDDPTPATPVGGNPGVTLGQQRIFVFQQAAAIWTEVLKPQQDVYVAAQFEPLGPGVLGSAGARFIWSNFPGAELENTWYFDSLADQLAQQDLSPTTYDITARFSTQFPFYLGFDNNDPPGTNDLLPVVLHEIGHGLNFANAVNEVSGTIPVPAGATEPYGDIYSQYTLDVTTNKVWNDMTDAERAASAVNVRKVSWKGLQVKRAVPKVLSRGEPILRVNNPAALGILMVGTAAFGPPLSAAAVTGDVVVGQDAADDAGPLTTDGCSPLTNSVSGRVVLLDRGTCAFVVKVLNAQNAGAIAVLIADNVVALPPPGLGGSDPAITIPAVRISLEDATNIRNALPTGVNVTLTVDRRILAGTDRVKGLMMLAALDPVSPGSSISHWDTAATPNQLMEPSINVDLTNSVEPPEDLTTPLLTDLGWFTDRDGVPDGGDTCLHSNLEPEVTIDSCDSNTPNNVLSNGCSFSDRLGECEVYRDRFPLLYLACVAERTEPWVRSKLITRRNQATIAFCAIKSLH